MNWKRKLSADCRLYLILDAEVNDPADLPRIAREAAAAGAAPFQLRYKHGSVRDILRVAQEIARQLPPESPFIVNDRLDICQAAGAQGVHLGQDDLPVRAARDILGADKIIGASCQSYDQALQAVAEGADYIGFGSVFKTQTKPERSPMDLELLQRVVREVSVPVYAIGGIGPDNLSTLREIGVTHAAICRSVSCARDVRRAAADLLRMLPVPMGAGREG